MKTPVNIQYMSDIHLEFGGPAPEPRHIVGDVVVFAGDIAVSPERAAQAIAPIAEVAPVIYILGNHEFYRQSWRAAVALYKKELSSVGGWGAVCLENETAIVKGVRFIGATLWTDFLDGAQAKSSEACLNDFRLITPPPGTIRMSAEMVRARYENSKAFIFQTLAHPFSGSTVVVTHSAPSFRSNPKEYENSSISGAFCCRLDAEIERNGPAVWIYGHTHANIDYTIGHTRVVTNQRGYPRESLSAFRFDACVTV